MTVERACPKHFIRKSELTLEEVFATIKAGKKKHNGVKVWMNRKRLAMYYMHGTDCAYCGIKGSFFAVERNKKRRRKKGGWHLHLYAETADGGVRMITMDHIIPSSQGGPTNIHNLIPACTRCNGNKGSMGVLEWLEHPKYRVATHYVRTIDWKKLISLDGWKRRIKFMFYTRKLPSLPKKQIALRHEVPILRDHNLQWLFCANKTF